MKIVRNIGTDRTIDIICPGLTSGHQLDVMTPAFSLFAFAEIQEALSGLKKANLLLPPEDTELGFLGSDADRASRNSLQTRWLARRCAEWVREKVELRRTPGSVPQGAAVIRNSVADPQQVILGSFAFSTDGLGITPGNPLSLIQASESADEAARLSQWFDMQWAALPAQPTAKDAFIDALQSLASHRDPFTIYTLILHHLFKDRGDELDEDSIVKSATGIRNTVVWKK